MISGADLIAGPARDIVESHRRAQCAAAATGQHRLFEAALRQRSTGKASPVNVMTGADQARPTFGFPFVEQFPRVNRID